VVEDRVWDEYAAGEAAVRRLVASWMSETSAAQEPGEPATGLPVPHASAREVIAAACRLATDGRPAHPHVQPAYGLRLIAEAMVLDEHPSAGDWTAEERREALDWITLLIHRQGEDGVQRLVGELSARR
jgi:hypothetical protein